MSNEAHGKENQGELEMDAYELIALSIRENRTVTEYPETAEEFEALVADLSAECDDNTEVYGRGFSGPENRGLVDFWGGADEGEPWRVEVVNPPSR